MPQVFPSAVASSSLKPSPREACAESPPKFAEGTSAGDRAALLTDERGSRFLSSAVTNKRDTTIAAVPRAHAHVRLLPVLNCTTALAVVVISSRAVVVCRTGPGTTGPVLPLDATACVERAAAG